MNYDENGLVQIANETATQNGDFEKTIKIILIIALICLVVFILYRIIRRILKNKTEVITCYTGGLGSGKTLFSVDKSLKLYKKQLGKFNREQLKCKILSVFHINGKRNFLNPLTGEIEKPLLLSSIPLLIEKGKRHSEPVYSAELSLEHLLLQTRIPYGSVCMIDEVGAVASQFDFKEKNVIETMDLFFRLYRHLVNGYIVCNDQCSSNINLVIRRRVNFIHNLANCYVFGRVCFHYERMISISEEIKSVDLVQGENRTDYQDNMTFRICWLKYKKNYDSRCYSVLYDGVPYKQIGFFDALKCFRLLRCPKDDEYTYSAKLLNYKSRADYKSLKKGGK